MAEALKLTGINNQSQRRVIVINLKTGYKSIEGKEVINSSSEITK